MNFAKPACGVRQRQPMSASVSKSKMPFIKSSAPLGRLIF